MAPAISARAAYPHPAVCTNIVPCSAPHSLTGRHGCCEMWRQWALRSVFLYILDGRLYFPYNLFKTEKNAQNLVNLSYGRIETGANFADR